MNSEQKATETGESFPHTRFRVMDNIRYLFTKHGLQLNKLAKQLVIHQIASLLLTILEQKISYPIILRWHEIQDDNIQTCDVNQEKTIQQEFYS